MLEMDWANFAIAVGGLGFLACLIFQIVIWKFLRPAKQMLWLGTIYLAAPVATSLALALFRRELSPWLPLAFFQASLGSAYVMTFPAIQARSPSLALVLWIWRRGGCRTADLAEFPGGAQLIEHRLQDLAADGLMSAGGKPSTAGLLLGRFFRWYRRTMRVPEAQG